MWNAFAVQKRQRWVWAWFPFASCRAGVGSILESVICPICPPVLLDVPVSNKNLTDTSSSLIPSPCPFSIDEQIFTVVLGRRKLFWNGPMCSDSFACCSNCLRSFISQSKARSVFLVRMLSPCRGRWAGCWEQGSSYVISGPWMP